VARVLVDEIDRKIIEILKRDARTPYLEMAKILKMSEGAIRRRVKRLVESGVIQRFTIETNQEGPAAVMLVSANPSIPTSQISKAMLKIDGVQKVFEVTGEFDVVALLSAPDTPRLNACIEKTRMLEGTNRTNTMMVLRYW
jgi:Lrp/AsnC family transcriptional regulator of lysine biosynthesis